MRLTDEQLVNLASFINQLDVDGITPVNLSDEVVNIIKADVKEDKPGKKKKTTVKKQRMTEAEKARAKCLMMAAEVNYDSKSRLALVIKNMENQMDFEITVMKHIRTYSTGEKRMEQEVGSRRGIMTLLKIKNTGLIKTVAKRFNLTESQLKNLLSGRGVLYKLEKALNSPNFIGKDFGYILFTPSKTGMVYKELLDVEKMKESYLDILQVKQRAKKKIVDNFNSKLNRKVDIQFL